MPHLYPKAFARPVPFVTEASVTDDATEEPEEPPPPVESPSRSPSRYSPGRRRRTAGAEAETDGDTVNTGVHTVTSSLGEDGDESVGTLGTEAPETVAALLPGGELGVMAQHKPGHQYEPVLDCKVRCVVRWVFRWMVRWIVGLGCARPATNVPLSPVINPHPNTYPRYPTSRLYRETLTRCRACSAARRSRRASRSSRPYTERRYVHNMGVQSAHVWHLPHVHLSLTCRRQPPTSKPLERSPQYNPITSRPCGFQDDAQRDAVRKRPMSTGGIRPRRIEVQTEAGVLDYLQRHAEIQEEVW